VATKLVNAALTMSGALADRLALVGGLAASGLAWRAMARRNARAGGIFLMIGILGGLAVGIAKGQLMLGVLTGTALGIAASLLVWLLDRRR
jgi:hypothetical protein